MKPWCKPRTERKSQMLSQLLSRFTVAIAIFLMAQIPGIAVAQENATSFKFSLFSIEGLVVGDTYSIDANFGERNGISVPVPFKFLAPREDGIEVILEPPSEGSGELIKVNFVTEDRQLIENMRLVNMRLPLGPRDERLTILARLLANNGFNQAVAGFEESEFIGVRETKIGDYEAVEAIGKYVDPDLGLMYVRLVGIPNPDRPESIFAIANIVASRVDLENLDDLARTRTGTMLRFFEYLSE